MESPPLGWMLALGLGWITSYFLAIAGAIALVLTVIRGVEARHQRTILRTAFWSSLTVVGVVLVAFIRLAKGGGLGFGVEDTSVGGGMTLSLSPFALFVAFVAETGLLGYLALRGVWRYLPLSLVALAIYIRLTLPFFFMFP